MLSVSGAFRKCFLLLTSQKNLSKTLGMFLTTHNTIVQPYSYEKELLNPAFFNIKKLLGTQSRWRSDDSKIEF